MGVEMLIIAAGSCERARDEALNMQNSPLAAALACASSTSGGSWQLLLIG